MNNITNETEVTAFIINRSKKQFKLLTLRNLSSDSTHYQLPTTRIREYETPLEAAYREVIEGLKISKKDIRYFRQIGEVKYYKPLLHKEVHMHNLLFIYEGDSLKSNYKWLSSFEFSNINPELSQFINTYNFPELFLKPSEFGLNRKEISLCNTSLQWRRVYELQKFEIRKILDYKIKLFHIGTTSVTNFIAKPIIDILLEYEDKSELQNIIGSLEGLGFKHFGEFGIEGRNYFTKGTESFTYFHLHSFQKGAEEIKNHLKVVKVLNNNEEFKKRYFEYKIDSSNLKREEYTNNKSKLINEILEYKL